MSEQINYGAATVGYGTPEERKIPIIDFLRMEFKDNRFTSISKLDDGNYILGVENLASSGRATHNYLYVSPESMFGLISTVHFFLASSGIDISTNVESFVEGMIHYDASENIGAAMEARFFKSPEKNTES